jgi:hypothetical protein
MVLPAREHSTAALALGLGYVEERFVPFSTL